MTTELKNDRFLKALMRQPVDVTPVWMMRQAGRYLPEYRKTRKQAGDFITLCQTPELACEVTLQPLERFPLDAAILFSDILTIPDAMGLGLSLIENQGPKFERPVRTQNDIQSLPMPDPESELRYVMDAVRLIRKELDGRVPLIGFAGSPWTLATYMIEGRSSKDFKLAKSMLYNDPKMMHNLLDHITRAIILYLNAQIAAGAQAVMIFDTWGGALSTPAYLEFSLGYMKQIVDQLVRVYDEQTIPVILFTKGSAQWISEIAATGCDAVGLDWMQDIGKARDQIGDRVALQGNMDPMVLYSSPDTIRKEVALILKNYGSGSGHIFNLGHGITPNVDPEHAAVFIDAVHKLSKPYHE
jgi:uroporphyrinogen decarboxylase